MGTLERQRRRVTVALFVGNALASTAFLAAISVASIAAAELLGSARLAGLPSALGTVGSALGASLLTTMSGRFGRRAVFSLGFGVAAVGGAIGMISQLTTSAVALFASMFIMGFGRAVAQLSRFAAGDIWPIERRASAIGFVVWAATIGSVIGPLMIVPASRIGTAYFDTELAGPFAFTGLGFALAALWYFATLRPEPLTLAVIGDEPAADEDSEIRPLRLLLRQPTVRLAFIVLMVSQFVMILVMTVTPLHIRGHHPGLTLVGGVMMAHTLGMFAIAPVTGFLVDHFGARRMIVAGALLLAASSLLAAAAGEAQAVLLTTSLLLLGVGWNFHLVAGSAVLQEGLLLGERLRLQGLADSVTWISGGVAAFGSGFLMAAWSFPGLSILAACISFLPLLALVDRRPSPVDAAGPGSGLTKADLSTGDPGN